MTDSEVSAAVFTSVIESSSSWDGVLLPHYPEGVPRVTILRITIPPHVKLEMHKHPIINAGIVLKGELTVLTEDGRSSVFKAGEGLVELVNAYHYGENRGEEPVDLIMFYAGTIDTLLSERG